MLESGIGKASAVLRIGICQVGGKRHTRSIVACKKYYKDVVVVVPFYRTLEKRPINGVATKHI
jgi:hypothetical protein